MAEADLYPPIKQFLADRGYEVKGEVHHCDVVAVRGEEPPLVVELKERLTLPLILQAVDRLTITDAVYIAFEVGKGQTLWRRHRRAVVRLLRRLGLGLLTVSTQGAVRVVLEPGPYRPRTNLARQQRLLSEFERRLGDPEAGGSANRKRLTAYRQNALTCAAVLQEHGMLKASEVQRRSGVLKAGAILAKNHYGWFHRVKVGHYEVTERGLAELDAWQEQFPAFDPRAPRAPVD